MKVSIVIPAFNEEQLLAETLRHVKTAAAAFTAARWEHEIIVCDNNSTDRTAEIARSAGASVVFEPINQIARARNRGAKAATGEWLVFIDADSHPTANLFSEVIGKIQAGRCLAGGCTIRMEAGHPLVSLLTVLWNCCSRMRRMLAGSFIFCETTAFRKIGGFNTELFAAEELDLSQRLRELAAATQREVVILHRHPLMTSGRKMRLYSRWELLRIFLRVTLNRKRALRSREACHTWYDGRR